MRYFVVQPYIAASGRGTITEKTQLMQEFQHVMVYFTGRRWNILISLSLVNRQENHMSVWIVNTFSDKFF